MYLQEAVERLRPGARYVAPIPAPGRRRASVRWLWGASLLMWQLSNPCCAPRVPGVAWGAKRCFAPTLPRRQAASGHLGWPRIPRTESRHTTREAPHGSGSYRGDEFAAAGSLPPPRGNERSMSGVSSLTRPQPIKVHSLPAPPPSRARSRARSSWPRRSGARGSWHRRARRCSTFCPRCPPFRRGCVSSRL